MNDHDYTQDPTDVEETLDRMEALISAYHRQDPATQQRISTISIMAATQLATPSYQNTGEEDQSEGKREPFGLGGEAQYSSSERVSGRFTVPTHVEDPSKYGHGLLLGSQDVFVTRGRAGLTGPIEKRPTTIMPITAAEAEEAVQRGDFQRELDSTNLTDEPDPAA
jgi:hypothetical protein